MHESNFTILKKGVDYKKKFEKVLLQFQTANLSSHAARHWIAQSIFDVLLKDVPESAKDARSLRGYMWREPIAFKDDIS